MGISLFLILHLGGTRGDHVASVITHHKTSEILVRAKYPCHWVGETGKRIKEQGGQGMRRAR